MSTAVMPKFQQPVFVTKPKRIWVEEEHSWVERPTSEINSDDEFDMEPEAWAAFDRLCDYYGIHQSRPRIKKSSRWT